MNCTDTSPFILFLFSNELLKTYTWANGDDYTGFFEGGLMHGRGTIRRFKSGEALVSIFHEGKPTDVGAMSELENSLIKPNNPGELAKEIKHYTSTKRLMIESELEENFKWNKVGKKTIETLER